ncbi:hypothetical protein [Alkaliphilus sp. B6464]|uniref:hypothetical protein n=1 Tax=Alkaliphilus sp. B6464 TaxID=2731219 RepID=UPI001BAABA55|nr:hypothetical protein [Alkaliphilus sp. B6464]QUH21086.1 hypothetical protein HYG84_15165 [Alkaliphilus sp. B6464]
MILKKELHRIQSYITNFPDMNICVLAGSKKLGEMYWNAIRKAINYKGEKPFIVSSRSKCNDGINFKNSLIIVCSKWWENPESRAFYDGYFRIANFAVVIGEIDWNY